MTDNALLETVLNYPLLYDYFAFDNVEDAFNTIYADFNGLRALLERVDITEELLNVYSEANVMTSAQFMQQIKANKELLNAYSEADVMTSAQYKQLIKAKNLRDFIDQFFITQTLEFLISCDQIKNGEYAKEQYVALNADVARKEIAKAESGLYSANSNIFQSYTNENMVKLMAGEFWSNGYVYTPRGSTVSTALDRNPEWTQAEKLALNAQNAISYPNATYQREASVKYNCHSYAWYSQSPNLHWINDPSLYMTDGSYRQTSLITGAKVHYYNGDHSGIVTNPNGPIVTSKWGKLALYTHALNDCPYATGVRYYTSN